MGFDYVPGDMIASLTAEGMGPIQEMTLNYAVAGFGPSRGTARTALGQISGRDVQWLQGEYVPGDTSISRGKFDFGGEIGVAADDPLPGGRARHGSATRRDANGSHRADRLHDQPCRRRGARPDDGPRLALEDPALAGGRRSRQPPARGPPRAGAAPPASRSSATPERAPGAGAE